MIPAVRAALTTAVTDEPCAIDIRELRVIDCAELREIADVAHDRKQPPFFDGASALVRRLWELTGYSGAAPGVTLR